MDKDTQKSQRAIREEEILQFWRENEIFNKSLEKESQKGEYVFYEGPPTANGKPGIHHLEARAFKDVVPRYKTMQGFHVRRKGGWDTHGLPVELQVEKKLGLDSKKAIEEYGIAKFNQQCKESVWEYLEYWNKFTERIGFWVDQKNPYVTYHNDYIESVWNVIKEADKKKLLYKDYKVVPWCPRCGTALSSHELAQGYEDVKDLSVYVKFKVKGQDNTYILAWTTTPWTLPGNVALAVGEKINYVKVKVNNEFYILADIKASSVLQDYEIIEHIKGKDLIGLEYEPLYPYLLNTIPESEKSKLEKAYKVYEADFVTTEDGTGVVHTAVMYGIDDFILGNKIGLPKHHLVGLDGKFLSGTDFLEGRFVRDEEVAVDIIKDLAHRGILLKKEKYEHSYPHCWRCKTALIYYARDSWYIRMTELRDNMVEENEGINWEPSYIKEGRFGEWLRDIKDWAISRERYWGSPLPVWICDECKKVEVIGSINDLKSKAKKSGNKYFVMRHGEADSNIRRIMSSDINADIHLTEKGKNQVKEALDKVREMNIDYIFTSPIIRAQETTKIIADNLGVQIPVITDERLCEYKIGNFEGKPKEEYDNSFSNELEKFTLRKDGSENLNDTKKRAAEFLNEVELKYQNKNILIVSHGDLIWMMFAASKGMTAKEALEFSEKNYSKNAEIKDLDFSPIPHNENYELDLHKPYIDEVELICDCGGKLTRTKEVMDVWLDSGTMPFSQDHYPFENKDFIDGAGYPADFISEAIDQTRGWFYTLHAVGAIMGKGKAYKNVICLGHLLDANGKKMSKSLGNIVDPWIMMDKYGVDTLRLWMYSVNQPGESKNFDEKTVSELHSKVFNLLYNVLAFYELYRDKNLEISGGSSSENILDKWIVTLLNKLIEDVTKNLDNYKLLEPVRAIRLFIDDLSTWYLRRSRERIKEGDQEAKQTLYYVLKTLIQLMAPFTPFASEDIWQKLKTEKDEESIHLSKWPKEASVDLKILEEMKIVREIVTIGLQKRQKENLPVRQPIAKVSATVVTSLTRGSSIIIKEELNSKEIEIKMGEEKNVDLDTRITEELRKEGQYRELLRAIQDIRKKNGLNPSDIVTLIVNTNKDGQDFINTFNKELMKAVGVKEILFKENDSEEIKIGELMFKVGIEK
ncbi:MAG TPA: class I tRNA ligase family protein [Candidatus Paceibacterota bacterium]|nr:class I tRNA ligase family protein [Candidatus Paceibacterota bacterium]